MERAMAMSTATPHTIWDCRWSRIGRWRHGVGEQQPETLWVCVRRPGTRRGVTEQECEQCEFWEVKDPDVPVSSR